MRTHKVWPMLATCFATAGIPLSAYGQAGAEAAPPQLETLEEGEAPAITIRQPDTGQQRTEKRAPGGKVTEIKVTKGKSTYYVKPNDQAGSALAGDAQSIALRPAQWEVLQFDLSLPQHSPPPDAAGGDVPPPPAVPATASPSAPNPQVSSQPKTKK